MLQHACLNMLEFANARVFRSSGERDCETALDLENRLLNSLF